MVSSILKTYQEGRPTSGETHKVLQLPTAAEIIQIGTRGSQDGKKHLLTIDLLFVFSYLSQHETVPWSWKTSVGCLPLP